MNIFQRFGGWITKIYKSSNNHITSKQTSQCKSCTQCQCASESKAKNKTTPLQTRRKFTVPRHKKDNLYQISMNIKADGEQTFDISFPPGVDDEQNAIIISEMMYRLTTDLGQEFHNSLSKGDKHSKVFTLALNMWQALVNHHHHGGVVIPPTRVFSSHS